MPERSDSRDLKLSVCRHLPRGRPQRREAAGTNLSGTGTGGEPAPALAQGISRARRSGLRAAPSRRTGSIGAARRGVGALLRATGTGERGAKKSLGANHIAERHAVIAEAVAAAPSLSVRQLCALLDVNRAW